MNEKDKNEMLEAILNENEAYQCKLWAVIMACLLYTSSESVEICGFHVFFLRLGHTGAALFFR